MLYESLTPDFMFSDSRGSLCQLVHQGYEQINILKSKAGAFRGGHFHKNSREAFYVVSGSVIVKLERDGMTEEVPFEEGSFFLIFPWVIHSMRFEEDCTMIAMYDKCVEADNGDKDIYKAEQGR